MRLKEIRPQITSFSKTPLSERDVSVNVLCFQVFTHGTEQFLSRAWLLDPVRTQVSAAVAQDGPSEPWNGEFYCSYGVSESRSLEDAVKYGFISAGGGLWYTKTLQLLNPGDRVWVKAPGYGFVGVCRVSQSRPLLHDASIFFRVSGGSESSFRP